MPFLSFHVLALKRYARKYGREASLAGCILPDYLPLVYNIEGLGGHVFTPEETHDIKNLEGLFPLSHKEWGYAPGLFEGWAHHLYLDEVVHEFIHHLLNVYTEFPRILTEGGMEPGMQHAFIEAVLDKVMALAPRGLFNRVTVTQADINSSFEDIDADAVSGCLAGAFGKDGTDVRGVIETARATPVELSALAQSTEIFLAPYDGLPGYMLHETNLDNKKGRESFLSYVESYAAENTLSLMNPQWR